MLIGPMGVGKSAIARALSTRLGLPLRDLDRELEAAGGLAISEIFERCGEAHFRAQESAALESCLTTPEQVVACGGGVVLAARNRAVLGRRNFVVWLDAPIELLLQRLARDRKRPLLAGTDLRSRLVELAAQRDPLYESCADLRFEVDAGSPARQATRLLERLPSPWREDLGP